MANYELDSFTRGSNTFSYSGGGDVQSVNGQTGEVVLDAEDVGALADTTTLADLSDDSTHRLVTDTEKTTWNGKSDFSGSYNDLTNKPTIPDAQIQSDWNQTDTTAKDFIKNKPSIPSGQVNADWEASSGVAEILHKPTLGTAAAKDSTATVTSGSTDLVESGAVKSAIDAAVASAYHPAGTKTVAELLPALLIAANEGNVYNMTDAGTTTSDFIEGAGKPIRIGDNVGIANVGSNTYKFDLLSGFIDTSDFVNKSSTVGLIKNDGTIDSTSYAPQSTTYTKTETDNAIAAAAYSLPIASDSTLGGIKVGSGLNIDPSTGELSATGSSNVSVLDDLTDVTITSPADGDVLVYDDTNEIWVNGSVPSGTMDYEDLSNKPSINGVTLDGNVSLSSLGLKETITLTQAEYDLLPQEEKEDPDITYFISDADPTFGLGNLQDVDITSPAADGDILVYDDANDKWVNEALTKSTIGLGNVDNTSDANKPISTATQAALDGKANVSDIAGVQTATGSIVTVDDAADIYAEQVDVAVVATQTGSGTPSPSNVRPIQGYDIVSVDTISKNRCKPISAVTTVKGITITPQSDGSVVLNGTKTTDSNAIVISDSFDVVANVTYVLSATVTDGTIRDYGLQGFGTQKTVTWSSNYTSSGFQVVINQGDVLNNVRVYPQIEIASSPSSFQPYGHNRVAVQLGNKNLLPMTVEGIKAANTTGTWSGNVYSINNGTVTVLTDKNGLVTGIKVNGTFNSVTWLRLGTPSIETGNYVLNGCPSGGGYDTYRITNENQTFKDDGNGVGGTLSSEELFIRVAATTVSDKIFYPMLRSASVTDPTFSPYNPTLGGMVYGGQLTLNDDGSAVFVGDKASVDLGSLTWQAIGATSSYDRYVTNSLDNIIKNYSQCLCSVYPFRSPSQGYVANSISITAPANTLSVFTDVGAYASATAFKTAMSGVQLVYELATPFTIHLSAEQLKLLQGTNNVWSNAGNVTLKYQPDNVIAEPKADVQRLRDDVDDRLVGNACRNLVEFPIKTLNGITSFKDSGKNLILNGTASASTNFDGNTFHLDAGTYTFSINEKLPSGTWFSLNNMGKTMFNGGSETKTATFTLDEGDYYFHLAISNGVTFNNYVLNPMVERGSSPSAYEEYYPSNRELWEMIKALQEQINTLTNNN